MAYRLSNIHRIFSVNCVEIIAFEYTDSISFRELFKKGDEAALVVNLEKSKLELVIQIGLETDKPHTLSSGLDPISANYN